MKNGGIPSGEGNPVVLGGNRPCRKGTAMATIWTQ
jgi:hypothetical protein